MGKIINRIRRKITEIMFKRIIQDIEYGEGHFDYDAVLEAEEELFNDFRNRNTSIISTLRYKYNRRCLRLMISSMMDKKYIKRSELLKFANFYVNTYNDMPDDIKVLFHIDDMKCSIQKQYSDLKKEAQYFKISVGLDLDPNIHVQRLVVSSSPLTDPCNIDITKKPFHDNIAAHIQEDSKIRMFLDTTESYDNFEMWEKVCRYVEAYIVHRIGEPITFRENKI